MITVYIIVYNQATPLEYFYSRDIPKKRNVTDPITQPWETPKVRVKVLDRIILSETLKLYISGVIKTN